MLNLPSIFTRKPLRVKLFSYAIQAWETGKSIFGGKYLLTYIPVNSGFHTGQVGAAGPYFPGPGLQLFNFHFFHVIRVKKRFPETRNRRFVHHATDCKKELSVTGTESTLI